MKSLLICFCAVLAALTFPLTASAHGLVATQQQTSGQYTVEFEYDVLSKIEAGQYTTYDFVVLDTKSQEAVSYDRVFVRFNKPDKSAFLTSSLIPIIGFGPPAARIAFSIPDTGGYSVSAEFYKNDNQIASANFNFDVAPSSDAATITANTRTSRLREYIIGLAGIAVGGGIALLFRKRKRLSGKKIAE